MTHPTVEYFRARGEIAAERNEEAAETLTLLMAKHPDLFWTLKEAKARLDASTSLINSLLDSLEDYVERERLLK